MRLSLSFAERNHVPPQRIYEIIKPAMSAETFAMPEEALGGTGQRKLSVLCEMYKLDVQKVIGALREQGIKATAAQTMKEIAAANGKDPHGVYAQIYKFSLK